MPVPSGLLAPIEASGVAFPDSTNPKSDAVYFKGGWFVVDTVNGLMLPQGSISGLALAPGSVSASALANGAATGAALGADVLVTGSSVQVKTGNLTAPLVDSGRMVYHSRSTTADEAGVADAQPQLQSLATSALVDGSLVRLSSGSFKLLSTLNLGDGTAATKLYFEGAGPNATFLNWYGSTAGVAVQINRLKYYKFSGIAVGNNSGALGTTIGILIDNGSFAGTQSGQCHWEQIAVGGFNVGIQFGGFSSVSEVLMNFIKATTCNTGMLIQTGNTLNFTINMWLGSANVDGLMISGNAGQVLVNGGSSSGNSNSDFNLSNAYPTTIQSFRSEGSNRFLVAGGATPTAINLIGCTSVASINADGVLIDVSAGGKPLNILGGFYAGSIKYAGSAYRSGLVNIQGVGIAALTPFTIYNTTYDVRYISIGNTRTDTAANHLNRFPDEIGIATGAGRFPAFRFGSYPVGATNEVELRSVSGISTTTARRNNLRGTATLVAGTVNVVFGTAEVQSIVATGATSGTFTLNFNGYDTALLNWNATAAQIQTALVALTSIGVGGVVCTLGPLPGTAVTITFAGPLVGGGPQNLITVTNNTVVGGTPTVTRTSAGTGNPPEPDTAYSVTANSAGTEAVGVSAKATTGFTLTVPGGASTNLVDWHLMG